MPSSLKHASPLSSSLKSKSLLSPHEPLPIVRPSSVQVLGRESSAVNFEGPATESQGNDANVSKDPFGERSAGHFPVSLSALLHPERVPLPIGSAALFKHTKGSRVYDGLFGLPVPLGNQLTSGAGGEADESDDEGSASCFQYQRTELLQVAVTLADTFAAPPSERVARAAVVLGLYAEDSAQVEYSGFAARGSTEASSWTTATEEMTSASLESSGTASGARAPATPVKEEWYIAKEDLTAFLKVHSPQHVGQEQQVLDQYNPEELMQMAMQSFGEAPPTTTRDPSAPSFDPFGADTAGGTSGGSDTSVSVLMDSSVVDVCMYTPGLSILSAPPAVPDERSYPRCYRPALEGKLADAPHVVRPADLLPYQPLADDVAAVEALATGRSRRRSDWTEVAEGDLASMTAAMHATMPGVDFVPGVSGVGLAMGAPITPFIMNGDGTGGDVGSTTAVLHTLPCLPYNGWEQQLRLALKPCSKQRKEACGIKQGRTGSRGRGGSGDETGWGLMPDLSPLVLHLSSLPQMSLSPSPVMHPPAGHRELVKGCDTLIITLDDCGIANPKNGAKFQIFYTVDGTEPMVVDEQVKFGMDAGKVIYKADTPSTIEYFPDAPYVWSAANPTPPPASSPPPELEFVEEGTYVVRALSCGDRHEDSIVTTHEYVIKVREQSCL
jgi:hypothetical protein